MAKRGVEEELEKLGRLREQPVTEATLAALRKALTDRVNLIAAKAGQIIGDLQMNPLLPDLLATFNRLFKNATETDPQCWGKNAIAKCLTGLEYDESAPFLRGYRFVQMESVWGGKTDTAVTLRSICTLALVQCRDLHRIEKMGHLVRAMTDRHEAVRIDAIRALEQLGGEEASLLLRLKAGIGEKRASVTGQAIESLLRLEGSRALDFAGEFLKESEPGDVRELPSTEEEVVEEAALAFGTSRMPEAVDALTQAWQRDPKPVFLRAVSLSRHERAFDFLLNVVRSGRERDALAAIDALSLHRESTEVRSELETAIATRKSAVLGERFYVSFGTV